jgi:hypothetical protein
MKQFVSSIFDGDLIEAQRILEERIEQIVEEKLQLIGMRVAEKLDDDLTEANVLKQGRTKLIRLRIRKGKVQRRVKKSAVQGFVFRGGKLTRMTPMERRHRKIAARRAKLKRKAKMGQSIRKRFRALQKRKAMGIQ